MSMYVWCVYVCGDVCGDVCMYVYGFLYQESCTFNGSIVKHLIPLDGASIETSPEF